MGEEKDLWAPSHEIVSISGNVDDGKQHRRNQASYYHHPGEPAVGVRPRQVVAEHRLVHLSGFPGSAVRES